jgi:hypothetical protein
MADNNSKPEGLGKSASTIQTPTWVVIAIVLIAIAVVALLITVIVLELEDDSCSGRSEFLVLQCEPDTVLVPPSTSGTVTMVYPNQEDTSIRSTDSVPFVSQDNGVFTVNRAGLFHLTSFVRLTKPVIQTRFQIIVQMAENLPRDGWVAAETLGGFPDGGSESTSIITGTVYLRKDDKFYFNVFTNTGDIVLTHGRLSIVRTD